MGKKDAKTYRPAFIVIDPEHPGSISTRKLLLETAKLNVLSCYSGGEGIATLHRFPNVDAVILNVDVRDMDCSEIVRQMKASVPKVPVILISAAGHTSNCDGVDHQISSYEPKELLDQVQKLFGRRGITGGHMHARVRLISDGGVPDPEPGAMTVSPKHPQGVPAWQKVPSPLRLRSLRSVDQHEYIRQELFVVDNKNTHKTESLCGRLFGNARFTE